MTFSIIARCPEAGRLGVAVASCVLGVGPRIVLTRTGVAAVAVHGGGWLHWRQLILDSIAAGDSAQQAITVVSADPRCVSTGDGDEDAVFTASPERASAVALAAQRVNPSAVTMLQRRFGPAVQAGDTRAAALLTAISDLGRS